MEVGQTHLHNIIFNSFPELYLQIKTPTTTFLHLAMQISFNCTMKPCPKEGNNKNLEEQSVIRQLLIPHSSKVWLH